MKSREYLLRAVQARLEYIRVTGRSESALDPDVQQSAARLEEYVRHADEYDPEVILVLGWLHWHRSQALPEHLHEEATASAAGYLTMAFLGGAEGLPEPMVPVILDGLTQLAFQKLEVAYASPDLQTLSEVIYAMTRVVAATPDAEPASIERLSCLTGALEARYGLTESLDDLDATIATGQRLIGRLSKDDPLRARLLAGISSLMLSRPERLAAIPDLADTIRTLRQVVVDCPESDPLKADYLSNLGSALSQHFKRTDSPADLNEAIDAFRRATAATPVDHPHHASYLANLCNALDLRCRRTGSLPDVDDAVAVIREALNSVPDDYPDRGGLQTSLGMALRDRFELTGDVSDLDEAVRLQGEAVAATAPGHHSRFARLGNRSAALYARYNRSNVLSDLDEAISTARQAADHLPADHPDLSTHLANLCSALSTRYTRCGHLPDLQEAIAFGRRAVATAPEGSPARARHAVSLGIALDNRFRRLRMIADIDEAIFGVKRAIQDMPEDHADRPGYLSNLGAMLLSKFHQFGELSDLDEAVAALSRAADDTPPGRPARAGYLSNLGGALRERFEHSHDLADVDHAIRVGRQAAESVAQDDPRLASCLFFLARSLRTRFESTHVSIDLDEAITAYLHAVEAAAKDDPNRASQLSGLGRALRARFEISGRSGDLADAALALSRASQVEGATPALRIDCAEAAAALVASDDPTRAVDLLETAVRLFADLTPHYLQRAAHEHALGRVFGLAGSAAALALADSSRPPRDRAARALSLLEAGRAVLLSQNLNAYSALTELRRKHPDLAQRLTSLREALETAETTTSSAIDQRIETAQDLAALQARIRGLDGFAAFGLPPTSDELVSQADDGFIVTINIAERRCDALILSKQGVSAIPLPDLTMQTALEHAAAFRTAVDLAHMPLLSGSLMQSIMTTTLEWLWDSIAEPVLETLGLRSTPAADDWPRLWWAPGGILSLMPLHAAGYHSDPAGSARRTVIDRVVSSYTPTVSVLRHARRRAHQAAEPNKSLIVAMPTTPGLRPLENVGDEVEAIKGLLPEALVLVEPQPGSDAGHDLLPTRDRVLDELQHRSIVHLACHASHDPANPANSGLLLHDHHDAPLTVSGLAPINLDHARLLYLSACQTGAATRAELLDESIHLVSAFQMAGFPQVIGTLWNLDDEIAVEIAHDCYRDMLDPDGTIDTTRTARALHRAIRAQRDAYPDTPSLWAAHVHFGA